MTYYNNYSGNLYNLNYQKESFFGTIQQIIIHLLNFDIIRIKNSSQNLKKKCIKGKNIFPDINSLLSTHHLSQLNLNLIIKL